MRTPLIILATTELSKGSLMVYWMSLMVNVKW